MLFKYAQREWATDSRLDLADNRSTKRYLIMTTTPTSVSSTI